MNYGNRNGVVVIWVVFTIMGSGIGLFFGSMAGEKLGFPLGDSLERSIQNISAFFPSNYLPSMTAGFVYGAVTGFFPALVQWLAVLRKQYKRSGIWVVLNMFAMAVAFSLNSGVYTFLNSVMDNQILLYLIYMFINGFLTGFVLGTFQWVFFSHKRAGAYWWLILNIVGWSMLSFVSFLGFLLEGQFFLLVEFIFIVIDSVGLALFTGLALYPTFPPPVREPEGITTI